MKRLREYAYATAEAVVFVGALVALFVYSWLLAPAGAAYPR